jgi:transposase
VIGTMTWAAMDVHARSTYAASMDVITGELSRQRFDTGAVEPVVAWLASLPGPVRCCYEAGPTGFGLYRAAGKAGIDCQVIAPSKTPRPAGDRNKSDRRDTDLLLRQLMAGALTAVAVPSATFEAARDLARAREQVRVDLMRCRHRLSKLLLRHGRVWDRSTWTKAHREWLGSQTYEHQNTELAFIDNLAACDGLTARRQALDERLSLVATDPEFWPIVRRLRAFRGIDTLSALILALEIADFARFPRAVQLGSWLGLVPKFAVVCIQQDAPDLQPDGGAPRLRRFQHLPALLSKPLGQQPQLGGFAATFGTFESNKNSASRQDLPR